MKQSEKYEVLQFVLWYYITNKIDINMLLLRDDEEYYVGHVRCTGTEIKDMWSRLLRFCDEARNREKTEEGENET